MQAPTPRVEDRPALFVRRPPDVGGSLPDRSLPDRSLPS